MMEVENVDSVVGTLHKLKVCARCILRLIGERSPLSYQGTYENVANSVFQRFGVEFNVITNSDKNSGNMKMNCDGDSDHDNTAECAPEYANTCMSCLGILQEQCDDSIIKKIGEEVENSGFEVEDFTFSVSLPLCILVRQHSIFLYLKEKFSELYSDKMSVNSFPSIKEVFKWVCGPVLGMNLGVFFKYESSFQILIKFGYNKEFEELQFLTEVDPSKFKERKSKKRAPVIPMFSGTSIGKTLDDVKSAEQLRKFTYCPPSIPKCSAYCTQVICSHLSILLAGRYNKYSRVLPQTPWIIDGERMLESSVQRWVYIQWDIWTTSKEKICDIISLKIKTDDCKFSSGGREDVDVRMLGTGRPFVVELLNPHKTILSKEFLANIQKEINSSTTDVKIRDLQIVTKDDYATLKEAENKKTKTYRQFAENIGPCKLKWTIAQPSSKQTQVDIMKSLNDFEQDLKLRQKTPLRVLHRRPLAVREKVIHSMTPEWKDSHHFRLYLKTMAGTYVKEFVHGDLGRTRPNIGSLLGSEADILELDVKSVDVNWPPSLESTPEASQLSD